MSIIPTINSFHSNPVLKPNNNKFEKSISDTDLKKFWPNEGQGDLSDDLEKKLDECLRTLDQITSIFIKGKEHKKMIGKHLDFYKKCNDLEKSKAIESAFKETRNTHQFISDEIIPKIRSKITKYSNYIGKNEKFLKEIFLNEKFTNSIIGNDIRNDELKQKVKSFLETFLSNFQREYQPVSSEQNFPLIIGTSSSGGAHRSIANAILARLAKYYDGVQISEKDKSFSFKGKEICKILNETELSDYNGDPLKKCTGIAYSRCYSEVEQKRNNASYSKKLRELSQKLALFIEYPHTTNIKENVGKTKYFVSTSHHDYNVRLLAEGVKELNFQICDFGAIYHKHKLNKVTKITYKYSLQEYIKFFAPSNNTYLIKKQSQIEFKNLEEKGMIAATGYPVREEFTDDKFKTKVQEKNQDKWFNPKREDTKKIFMVMGAEGVGGILNEYIQCIIKNNKDTPMSILVGCGNNDALKERIKAIECSNPYVDIQPIGFTNDIPFIGSLCDAYVTKPGGATVAEGLYAGFPMLLHKNINSKWEFGNIDEAKRVGGAIEIEPEKFYDNLKTRITTDRRPGVPYPKNDPVSYIYHKLQEFSRAQMPDSFLETV